MGLRPKKDFKENINLEWFVFKFQNLFNKLRIGDKDGQKSLNKKILEEVKISIPDINVQEEELKLYKKAKSVLASLEQLKKETEDLLENEMI
jgi:restriction endonuclease S subunit